MTVYISDPIPVDRASIRAEMDDAAEALSPGIDTTSPLTPYDFFANIFSGMHAEALQTFTQQLKASFKYGLEKIDRISKRDAVQATASAVLTRTDSPERLVQAGTEFNLLGADGIAVPFQTKVDVTFAAADLSEPVELIAVQGGTGANGLSTVIGPALTSTWYGSLVLGAPSSGGEDGETDDEFVDRGADTRPGRAFTIVLPDDLARFLRNEPGVDRVLVLNNYNADTATSGVGGHMTGIPIDADGAALSGGTMTTLEASAQEIANLNGTIHIAGPTKTNVAVVFAGVASVGYDPDDVNDRAEVEVLAFLAGSRWGLPDGGDVRGWNETLTVRHQDIGTILNNVQGFDYWTTLTINGVAADFTLPGPGALPGAGSTCSGTTAAP